MHLSITYYLLQNNNKSFLQRINRYFYIVLRYESLSIINK